MDFSGIVMTTDILLILPFTDGSHTSKKNQSFAPQMSVLKCGSSKPFSFPNDTSPQKLVYRKMSSPYYITIHRQGIGVILGEIQAVCLYCAIIMAKMIASISLLKISFHNKII